MDNKEFGTEIAKTAIACAGGACASMYVGKIVKCVSLAEGNIFQKIAFKIGSVLVASWISYKVEEYVMDGIVEPIFNAGKTISEARQEHKKAKEFGPVPALCTEPLYIEFDNEDSVHKFLNAVEARVNVDDAKMTMSDIDGDIQNWCPFTVRDTIELAQIGGTVIDLGDESKYFDRYGWNSAKEFFDGFDYFDSENGSIMAKIPSCVYFGEEG